MKKYLAALLSLVMVLTTVFSAVGGSLSVEAADQTNTITANKATAVPDMNSAISADTWGQPVIHVDKDTENAYLRQYNAAVPEDTAMDIYTLWDENNLYIGVVSADDDLRGGAGTDFWTGDGIQFKISSGSTISSEALDICVTLNEALDGIIPDTRHESLNANIVVADGKLNVMVAVPFEELGMVASDIEVGAPLSFNILRIIGTAENNYAGWLAWGAYFGAGHEHNADCYADNNIVLGEAKEVQSNIISANKVSAAPDMSSAISTATWGEPAASVNKDTYNATLFRYNADVPQDVSMDIYTAWDDTNLYIGVVSADNDLRGGAGTDFWTGDGIQFKISSGSTISSEALDICVTLNEALDGIIPDTRHESLNANIVVADGKLNVMVAVPFEDLGMVASDIKAGAPLSFNILRIIGTAENNYAGWLAWGAYFGAGSANNVNSIADNNIILSENTVVQANVITANKALSAPNMNSAISAAAWGEPAISVNKDTYNATLFRYNADVPQDVSMDIYTLWDDTNMYIGVVSADNDLRGGAGTDFWTGDGIQFKISSGSSISSEAKDICVTLNESLDGIIPDTRHESLNANIVVADGKINVMVAVPFADLGMTASDIKAGAPLSFNILRIIGTAENNYAGWLAWGAYFGAGSANNANSNVDNNIILSDETVDQANVFTANKALSAPDMKSAISAATWGEPAVSVNKDTYNATLFRYNADVPQDVSMDIYTLWDDTNLYIGVVSADDDLRGGAGTDFWTGDGIQFKISSGSSISSEAKDICVTLNEDLDGIIPDTRHENLNANLVVADGKINVMVAVPFADLGMTASDIKDGAPLSFNILRIIGTAENNYAGWLAWGAYFGAGSANNANSNADNNIILSDTAVEQATVITSDKTTSVPNMNSAISAAVWGEPVTHVDKDTYNATLFRYNADVPQDVSMDIYTLWDDTNLYIGVVSADDDLRGGAGTDFWTGDGIQFKISSGKTISSEAKDICVTLNESLDGIIPDTRHENLNANIVVADGKINVMVAVPFADLGMTASDIKDGAPLSFNILRIIGTAENNYAGWLAWGAYFGAGSANNANSYTDNNIILVDPNANAGGGEEEEFVSSITNITQASQTYNKGNAESRTHGYKAVTTHDGTFFVFQSVGDIAVLASDNSKSMMNEFSIHQLCDDPEGNQTAVEVAYGYTYHNNVDLVADVEGTMYVVGGSSSAQTHALSSNYNYDDEVQFARLNVHVYDAETQSLTGYMKQLDFANQDAGTYAYLTTTIDQENGLIYIFFLSEGASVEYFTFNVADNTWAYGDQWDLQAVPNNSYAMFIGGEVCLVYATDNDIILVSNSYGDQVVDGEAVELQDALVRADGSALVLYKENDLVKQISIRADGSLEGVQTTEISAALNSAMTEIDGVVYTIAVSEGQGVTATVYSGTGDACEKVHEKKLDEIIEACELPITVKANNGSLQNDEALLVFAGKRVRFEYWYYCNLATTTSYIQ